MFVQKIMIEMPAYRIKCGRCPKSIERRDQVELLKVAYMDGWQVLEKKTSDVAIVLCPNCAAQRSIWHIIEKMKDEPHLLESQLNEIVGWLLERESA